MQELTDQAAEAGHVQKVERLEFMYKGGPGMGGLGMGGPGMGVPSEDADAYLLGEKRFEAPGATTPWRARARRAREPARRAPGGGEERNLEQAQLGPTADDARPGAGGAEGDHEEPGGAARARAARRARATAPGKEGKEARAEGGEEGGETRAGRRKFARRCDGRCSGRTPRPRHAADRGTWTREENEKSAEDVAAGLPRRRPTRIRIRIRIRGGAAGSARGRGRGRGRATRTAGRPGTTSGHPGGTTAGRDVNARRRRDGGRESPRRSPRSRSPPLAARDGASARDGSKGCRLTYANERGERVAAVRRERRDEWRERARDARGGDEAARVERREKEARWASRVKRRRAEEHRGTRNR